MDSSMDVISIRISDLYRRTTAVRDALAEAKDLVVTSNGRPIAILSSTTPSGVQATLRALRQARAELAVRTMQHQARAAGLNRWTAEQVNAEIREARQLRHG